MEYPTKEGKYGLIYTIANGIRVTRTKYGTWQLSLKLKGCRKRKNFSGDNALEKAIKAGEQLAVQLKIAPNGNKSHIVTFDQVSDEWLAANRNRWADGTYERYYTIVRDYLRPVIGGIPIGRVNRNHVRNLLLDVLEIRSQKTVELVHAVISGIFTEAIEERGYINHNSAAKLLKKLLRPKNKRNQRQPDPLSRTDLDRFLTVTWSSLAYPFGLIHETLAHSGMRLGECLAIHIDHLDIPNCQYMVSQTMRRGQFGLPKTGRRLIDLPESLVSKFEKHILKFKKQALRVGERVGYLFPGITQRMVQESAKKACRFAKLRKRRPHDLRHTYATLLLMEHYSPAYVQKQLGHYSIEMTVDTYGHWMPGEGRKDLDHALRGTSKGHGPRKKDPKVAYLTKVK